MVCSEVYQGVKGGWQAQEWELNASDGVLSTMSKRHHRRNKKKERFELLSGCEVSDLSFVEEKGLFAFTVSWPDRESTETLSDDEDEQAPPKFACGPSARKRRRTGKQIATVGAAGLAVGVGGLAIGALTLGVGLVPYAAVCGIAISGGGVLTRRQRSQQKKESNSLLLRLGFMDEDVAKVWRLAIEKAIPESSFLPSTEEVSSVAPNETRRSIQVAYFRGGLLRKWREGNSTFAATRVDIDAGGHRLLRALLGGESQLLVKTGGVIGRLEQIDAVNETSDVAIVATRPLAPSIEIFFGTLSSNNLKATRHQKKFSFMVLKMFFSTTYAWLRCFLLYVTTWSSYDAYICRQQFFKSLWLSWALLAAVARRFAVMAPQLQATRFAVRCTHLRPRLFKVRRSWRVNEKTGECLLELKSFESSDRFDAFFSVKPRDNSKTSCVLSLCARVSCDESLQRNKRDTSLEAFRDSVASLFVSEIAGGCVFDLRDAIEQLSRKKTNSLFRTRTQQKQQPPSLAESIRRCRENIKNGEANVANATDPEHRRKLVKHLSLNLAELRRLTGPDAASLPVFNTSTSEEEAKQQQPQTHVNDDNKKEQLTTPKPDDKDDIHQKAPLLLDENNNALFEADLWRLLPATDVANNHHHQRSRHGPNGLHPALDALLTATAILSIYLIVTHLAT